MTLRTCEHGPPSATGADSLTSVLPNFAFTAAMLLGEGATELAQQLAGRRLSPLARSLGPASIAVLAYWRPPAGVHHSSLARMRIGLVRRVIEGMEPTLEVRRAKAESKGESRQCPTPGHH